MYLIFDVTFFRNTPFPRGRHIVSKSLEFNEPIAASLQYAHLESESETCDGYVFSKVETALLKTFSFTSDS